MEASSNNFCLPGIIFNAELYYSPPKVIVAFEFYFMFDLYFIFYILLQEKIRPPEIISPVKNILQ